MRPRIVPGLAALLIAALVAPSARADEETSRLLALVSLAYRTAGGAEVPRTHDVLAYEPFLRSNRADVRKVAALSAAWERLAAKERTPLVGAVPRLVAEVLRREGTNDPQLRAFIEEFRTKAGEADGLFGPLLNEQADRYKLERRMTQGQQLLWDAAEALARTQAGRAAGDDLVVTTRTEKGTGMLLSARNRSDRPLNRLTVVARVEKRPMKGLSDGMNRALGGLVGGDGDPGAGANTFANSVDDYYAARNAPDRLFVHIPRLDPGAEITLPLFPPGAPLNYTRATAASYSAWSDEIAVESTKLASFDPIIAANKRRVEEALAKEKAFAERVRTSGPFGGARPGTPPRNPAADAATRLAQAQQVARNDPIRARMAFRILARQAPDTPAGKEAQRWVDNYPELLMDLAAKAGKNTLVAAKFLREVRRFDSGASAEQKARALDRLDDLARPVLEQARRLEKSGNLAGARNLYSQVSTQAPGTESAKQAMQQLRGLPTRLR